MDADEIAQIFRESREGMKAQKIEGNMETNEIAAALAKAQGAMTAAKFDQVNPHFKSKFASLASVIEAVRKPLTDNGIAFVQRSEVEPNGVKVETVFYHSSGQSISAGSIFVPVDRANAHAVGSALTYAKRYGLSLACGISADQDDDGNQAVAKPTSVAAAALDGIKVDHKKANEYAAGLAAAVFNEDLAGIRELLDELQDDKDLKIATWAKLSSKERAYIKKEVANA